MRLEVTDLEKRDLSPPKKPGPDAGKQKYEPTEREKTALDRYHAQKATAPAAPRIKVSAGEKATVISLDHPDELVGLALLTQALGTVDRDFVSGLLTQLGSASSQDKRPDETAINFLLSVIKGGKPKDQFEAILAAQMAAIHTATMTFARRLANVETIQHQDSAEPALNKLARTYAMQMEALKRYRTGGEQKVTVHHVSVNKGGQAIVGNVNQAASGTAAEMPVTTTPALSDASMPIIETTPAQVVPLRTKKNDGG
jgi:hypothetical protein